MFRELFEKRAQLQELMASFGMICEQPLERGWVKRIRCVYYRVSLGHNNVRTTQRYVRATDRNKREAVQATLISQAGHNLATRVNANTQIQVVA